MHAELLRLAQQQQGLLSVEQLAEYGAGGLRWERRSDGEWSELQPGVCLPASVVPSARVRREAVRLFLEARRRRTGQPWCFAATTAAELSSLRVPPGAAITVAVEGSQRPALRGVEILTARRLPVLRRVRGNPLPALGVVVVQCAAVLARDDLVTLVEHAVRDRRCTLAQLRAVCGRGVSGSTALRGVLDELARDGRDRWVRVLVRLLVGAGLPAPERERPVPLEDPQVFLDGAWWSLKLAFEVDDWETHGDRNAQERDRARDRWLLREFGVVVLRVTPREIRDRPDRVVADIVSAYRRAAARDL